MALPHLYRLPLRFERERLNAQGIRHQSSLFTLVKAPSPSTLHHSRFAVLLSKKLSPLSSTRNHLKRLTTEALTPLLDQVSQADYLLIPKKELLSTSYAEIESDLKRLFSHHD